MVKLTSEISSILLFLNIFLFIYAFSQKSNLMNTALKWLVLYLAFALFLSILEHFLKTYIFKKTFIKVHPEIGEFLKHYKIKRMDFLNPLWYFLKFIFYGLFFRSLLLNDKYKKVIFWVTIGLVVFELVRVFVYDSYQSYDSLSSTVKNIFIIAASAVVFYRIYAAKDISIALNKNTYFWVILALLLPALGELYLELTFSKLSQTDENQYYTLYIVRNIIQLFGLVLMAIGISRSYYLQFLDKQY